VAPLRQPVFRALWLAQFVANTGTLMRPSARSG
jgi:hypothetical protein